MRMMFGYLRGWAGVWIPRLSNEFSASATDLINGGSPGPESGDLIIVPAPPLEVPEGGSE